MREVLTATMMSTLLGCMRKYFFRYELCLQSTADRAALSFGSAWHRAMDARWSGGDAGAALAAALSVDADTLDELQVATLSGLLAGYYARYSEDPIAELKPEQEFRLPLAGSRTFDAAGKIDGLGTTKAGRSVLLENKTTSDNIAPESDYWLRLRFNPQILQYVHAARMLGNAVDEIMYDVVKKPGIRPKTIPELDEQGRKIVKDSSGARVLKKDGTPRESAGDGMVLQSRMETPEEYGDRLKADTLERPDFYFARREVPVLDGDLAEFLIQRLEISRMILSMRRSARHADKPCHAWPRNCGEMTCGFCEFKDFCLQNISVDPVHQPAGFVVGERNPELAGK